jgi:hypothetical protein
LKDRVLFCAGVVGSRKGGLRHSSRPAFAARRFPRKGVADAGADLIILSFGPALRGGSRSGMLVDGH